MNTETPYSNLHPKGATGIIFTPSRFTPVEITTLWGGATGKNHETVTNEMFDGGVVPQVGDAVELYVFERLDTELSTKLSLKFRVKR